MADDPQLAALRQQRMQQMMQEGGGTGAGGQPNQEQMEKMQEEARAREESMQAMLHAFMEPEARARLTRIKLVKPDKAAIVEQNIVQLGSKGRLGGKISENMLIQMLEQVNQNTGGAGGSQPKITISRRRNILEDDD